jgi:hypothetical protein
MWRFFRVYPYNRRIRGIITAFPKKIKNFTFIMFRGFGVSREWNDFERGEGLCPAARIIYVPRFRRQPRVERF